MKPLQWYQKPEMIVAFSALFISVLTALVGIYSAYTDRTYARASVWPRIEIYRSFGSKKFELSVSNVGTGPALIKYAKIKYQSKTIKKWNDLPKIEKFVQSHIGNRILPAQKIIKVISYKGDNVANYLTIDNELTIELCYCSIYNECWLTNRDNQPEQVNECTIKKEDMFLQ